MVLVPDSFMASMRLISRSSTHGPFFDERDIYLFPPFLRPRRRPRTMNWSEPLRFLRVR
jgi:hypothetical protein